MRHVRLVIAAALVCACTFAASSPAFAQQRPLDTQDPETIGAGRVLLQGGIDWSHNNEYPVSGLKGDLVKIPTIGIVVGLSSIAELQILGAPYQSLSISSSNPGAPLANLLTVAGDSTHDVDDIIVATKIRILSENENRPAIGIRFATKLPNASNESGLGTDTTDFLATLLGAKTVQSIRVVGNIGAGILADPTDGNRQNDVLLYGASLARAVTQQVEFVGDINGRLSTRGGGPFPGTESRWILKFGGRYTYGPVRVDAGIFFGMTSIDPTVGFTAGVTYVFDAFKVP